MTRLATVVDDLIALVGQVTDLQVLDGATLGEVDPDGAVLVGYSETRDDPPYRSTVFREDGLGYPQLREAWTVDCFLVASHGGTSVVALRQSVQGYLQQIDAGLRSNAVTATWAEAGLLGSSRWAMSQTSAGAVVAVEFEVQGLNFL